MNLHNLPKATKKGKKRLGRGLGSGKGKTGGRGMKGQKARGKVPVGFIGGTLPLHKKLPFMRGKGNPKVTQKSKVVNLYQIQHLKAKTIVDTEELLRQGIISKDDLKKPIKILGKGELKNPLMMKLPVSDQAKEKILAAGGKVENA